MHERDDDETPKDLPAVLRWRAESALAELASDEPAAPGLGAAEVRRMLHELEIPRESWFELYELAPGGATRWVQLSASVAQVREGVRTLRIVLVDASMPSARVRGYVQHINDAGKHLLKLVEDVLDISRSTSGVLALNLVDTDVLAALRNAVLAVEADARACRVEISLKEPMETAATVRADPTHSFFIDSITVQ